MPDVPLPPLPPDGQPQWRTTWNELLRRLPFGPGTIVTMGLAVVALVVAGALLRPRGPVTAAAMPSVVPAPAEVTDPAEQATKPAGRDREDVVVDVAGAVTRPGLVRLRPGSRVADAVSAAGGVAADADVAGLNQARVVGDGEQVRVPRVGEPVAPTSVAAGPGGPLAGAPAAPVDLNRATAAELDTLPGVGPATAAAIITWRDENGGFRRIEDLVEVPGIGPARLERLRTLVRV